MEICRNYFTRRLKKGCDKTIKIVLSQLFEYVIISTLTLYMLFCTKGAASFGTTSVGSFVVSTASTDFSRYFPAITLFNEYSYFV